MDVRQQVHQTAWSLHPLSDRFPVFALIHPVRLLSWLNQALRDVDPECGEFQSPLFITEAGPRSEQSVLVLTTCLRLPGAVEKAPTRLTLHEWFG